ncbi:MAG: threonylcarbamoyl-AMP synthase [Thaumarchaeota archaeon]|nr:threonylcarbamoyl-AMP synthase [Nitrososphaerota archaeon]
MIVHCDHEGISKASATIKNGGILIFPTDTVYGIGCDPFNQDAVRKIYKIKGREESKQLPVLGYSFSEVAKIAVFDDLSLRIASRFWPGPLTLVLPVKGGEISRSLGMDKKIAVRVPDHPCLLQLLRICGLLIGTSANRSGQPPATNASGVVGKLEGYDVLLDGGDIPNPAESTIVEVTGGKVGILRKGKIDEKEIMSLV